MKTLLLSIAAATCGVISMAALSSSPFESVANESVVDLYGGGCLKKAASGCREITGSGPNGTRLGKENGCGTQTGHAVVRNTTGGWRNQGWLIRCTTDDSKVCGATLDLFKCVDATPIGSTSLLGSVGN